MIQIRFSFREPEGGVRLTLRGHAGFAPKGRDLVCAGASTLVYTLAEALERMYIQGMLRKCPRMEIREGRADLEALPKPEYVQEILLVFWVIEAGLHNLGMQFPGCIQVEEALKVRR